MITHIMEPWLSGRAGVLMIEELGDQTELTAWRYADGPSGAPDRGDTEEGTPVRLKILARTDSCVTVDVPDGPAGIYAVLAQPGEDRHSAQRVNRPRLDWHYPAVLSLGATARFLGRNLVSAEHYPTVDPDRPVSFGGLLEGQTRMILRPVDGGKDVELSVARSSAYEAHVALPADLRAGEFDVFAHNGHGGAAGWSDPLRVTLSVADPWPAEVFRVDDYLEPGRPAGHTNWEFSGNFTDSCMYYADDAIARALAAAERNGGGIVEFSTRVYDISRTIVVPRRVVLRGQGLDATWIRTPLGRGPCPPYVMITGEGDFAVEDLRLLTFYAPVIINVPTWVPESFEEASGRPHMSMQGDERRGANVSIRRCHLAQRLTAAKNRRLDSGRCSDAEKAFLARLDEFYRAGADNCQPRLILCGIHLRGDRMEVEGCTILAAMHGIELIGTRSARLSGNTIKAGNAGNCLSMFGENLPPADGGGLDIRGNHLREIVLEDNVMTGHEGRSRNGFFFYQSGSCAHVARNRIFDLSRDGDGEAMGTHLWMDRWPGVRLRMTGPKRGELVDRDGRSLPQRLPEMVLEIVNGPGAGQLRTIVGQSGDTIELDRPWACPPGADSVTVLVAPSPFHKLVLVDNRVENTGANIIIWGSSNDVVIDGNYTADGSGIGIWSIYRSFAGEIWGGAAFTQVINNTLDIGAFLPDEEAFWRATVDTLNGQGVIATIGSKAGNTPGYDFLGLIIRNNSLRHNSGIYYRRTFPLAKAGGGLMTLRDAGVVIERNRSRDCEYGVVVEAGGAPVVRRNSTERVRFPAVLIDGISRTIRPLKE